MLVPVAAPAATQPTTKATQIVRASHGRRALQRPILAGDRRTARVRPICLRVIPAASHLRGRRRSGLLLVIIVILRWDQSVPLRWARSRPHGDRDPGGAPGTAGPDGSNAA